MKDEEEEDTIIEEVDSEKDEIEEFEDVVIASGDQADAAEASLARNEASNQEADRRNVPLSISLCCVVISIAAACRNFCEVRCSHVKPNLSRNCI